ncbi:hypothetical protein BC834DRAFT_905282 [Gloeopeniophorella convolvens]|nr:hypothetical protein BC834DRAFT_905282 [Gloeopeniophorella convolvens]
MLYRARTAIRYSRSSQVLRVRIPLAYVHAPPLTRPRTRPFDKVIPRALPLLDVALGTAAPAQLQGPPFVMSASSTKVSCARWHLGNGAGNSTESRTGVPSAATSASRSNYPRSNVPQPGRRHREGSQQRPTVRPLPTGAMTYPSRRAAERRGSLPQPREDCTIDPLQ